MSFFTDQAEHAGAKKEMTSFDTIKKCKALPVKTAQHLAIKTNLQWKSPDFKE